MWSIIFNVIFLLLYTIIHLTHTFNRSKLIPEELNLSSVNAMCYDVFVFVPVVFANSLFLLGNLDPVDINFHKSGGRYIATLIRVLKYQTRRELKTCIVVSDTKALSAIFPFANVSVILSKSRQNMAGVTTAKLLRHLTNIHVI